MSHSRELLHEKTKDSFPQIDLEASEDDIEEIQKEISVLSTCASPFVTRYKTSFLRGHKLWIVMEYLGGGSCLDLVCYIAQCRYEFQIYIFTLA